MDGIKKLFGDNNLLIFGGDYFIIHDTDKTSYSFFIDDQSIFADEETKEKSYHFYYPEELNKIQEPYEGKIIFNNGHSVKEIKKSPFRILCLK